MVESFYRKVSSWFAATTGSRFCPLLSSTTSQGDSKSAVGKHKSHGWQGRCRGNWLTCVHCGCSRRRMGFAISSTFYVCFPCWTSDAPHSCLQPSSFPISFVKQHDATMAKIRFGIDLMSQRSNEQYIVQHGSLCHQVSLEIIFLFSLYDCELRWIFFLTSY